MPKADLMFSFYGFNVAYRRFETICLACVLFPTDHHCSLFQNLLASSSASTRPPGGPSPLEEPLPRPSSPRTRSRPLNLALRSASQPSKTSEAFSQDGPPTPGWPAFQLLVNISLTLVWKELSLAPRSGQSPHFGLLQWRRVPHCST